MARIVLVSAAMRVVYEDGVAGRTVVDSAGRALGTVVAAVIETSSWRLESLRVKMRRDVAEAVGVPHGTFRAPIISVPIAEVQGVSDAIVLRRPITDVWRELTEQAPPPPAGP